MIAMVRICGGRSGAEAGVGDGAEERKRKRRLRIEGGGSGGHFCGLSDHLVPILTVGRESNRARFRTMNITSMKSTHIGLFNIELLPNYAVF